jgi:hypothetical protein
VANPLSPSRAQPREPGQNLGRPDQAGDDQAHGKALGSLMNFVDGL